MLYAICSFNVNLPTNLLLWCLFLITWEENVLQLFDFNHSFTFFFTNSLPFFNIDFKFSYKPNQIQSISCILQFSRNFFLFTCFIEKWKSRLKSEVLPRIDVQWVTIVFVLFQYIHKFFRKYQIEWSTKQNRIKASITVWLSIVN